MYEPNPIGEKMEELKINVSDEELLQITQRWLDIGTKYNQTIKTDYEESKAYYVGKQIEDEQGIADNRIFMALETIIPIATSSVPAPNVLPARNTVESIELARLWEKVLTFNYTHQNLQKKLERFVSHLLLAKFACVKYFFDEEKLEVQTRVVHPCRVIFDNDRDSNDEIEWIGEYITKPASELIELFPAKTKEIKELVQNKLATRLTYTEFWSKDFVVQRLKNIILNKSKNPNYNFANIKKNYFYRPRVPYIITNLFDLGETVTGVTSLLDQCKSLQDGVNKRKNQIDKNANIVNGKVMGTGENGMTRREFASIDWSDSEQGIFIDKGEINDIVRLTGSPLPQFVENDMIHSISEIDNIMGTHSTTRGEREGRETATGRTILRESDRGRIDVIGRRLEEVVEKLFNGWTQIIKVHYKTKRTVVILGKDKAKEFLEFNSNTIEDGMQIEVIKGSMLPEDKGARRERALLLANAQLIDPITLFTEIGIRNPEEAAKNLYTWQTNPVALFPDLQQEQQAQGEQGTEASLQKAQDENKRMISGQPQPPFEGADGNHIRAHEQVMQSEEFAGLDNKIKQLFIDHVQEEVAIVQEKVKTT